MRRSGTLRSTRAQRAKNRHSRAGASRKSSLFAWWGKCSAISRRPRNSRIPKASRTPTRTPGKKTNAPYARKPRPLRKKEGQAWSWWDRGEKRSQATLLQKGMSQGTAARSPEWLRGWRPQSRMRFESHARIRSAEWDYPTSQKIRSGQRWGKFLARSWHMPSRNRTIALEETEACRRRRSSLWASGYRLRRWAIAEWRAGPTSRIAQVHHVDASVRE